MKILIISLPRTGSTQLLFDLSKKYKLKPLFEPFDGSGRYHYNENEDNIILKTIINQYPDNIELSKNFDEIILLSRRNLSECAESYAYFHHNKIKGFKSNKDYYYEGINEEDYESIFNRIKEYDSDLNKLSNELNVKVTYYEDLFDTNSQDRLRKFKKEDIIKSKII